MQRIENSDDVSSTKKGLPIIALLLTRTLCTCYTKWCYFGCQILSKSCQTKRLNPSCRRRRRMLCRLSPSTADHLSRVNR
jgi:hypothetical protein